jgi:FHA domain/zinc-ribbon domain
MKEKSKQESGIQPGICPQCKHPLSADARNCPNCGFAIKNPATIETRLLNPTEAPEIKRAPVGNIPLYFQRIRFLIDGKNYELPVSANLIVGRHDEASPDPAPDVDLTPFGALEKGVSREHLSLTWKNDLIYVADLESTNGTMLNGQHLLPGIARLLRDGDELMIGQLIVRVHFSDTNHA